MGCSTRVCSPDRDRYLFVMKAKALCLARMGLAILLGGSVAGWIGAEQKAAAQVNLSVGLNIQSPADFYGPLSPYGTWVDVSQYGQCWRPVDVAPGWRPYTIGQWEWTDVGWYWVTEEPWGWATCHYGYWTVDPFYGWVWVPGVEWAPAWVVWREAPDYIGWAPCGPGGVVTSDSFFVFSDVHHFHDRFQPRDLVFNDPAILRRSRPVGRFRTETRDFDGVRRQVAINQGPGVDPIQRATGTRFTPRPVTELVRQTPIPESARRTLSQSNTLRSRATQQPAPSPTGREQQRLYREAPPAQPPPTSRQEQRLYREVPSPQPSPQPVPAPQPIPRRQPVPEVSQPPVAAPERALPPTGRQSGRMEPQVPRRAEPAPRVEPPPVRVEPPPAVRVEPPPRLAPAEPPRGEFAPPVRPPQERERQRGDGQ